MTLVRGIAALLGIALLFGPLPTMATTDLLQTDLETVMAEAARVNRPVYVAFLGDGWSLASKRFKANLLDTPAFKEFASQRLLYYRVHARRQAAKAKQETARLQSLVIHFDIKAYPTVILIAPDGTEVLRHGYREESAEDYLKLLEAVLPPPGDD